MPTLPPDHAAIFYATKSNILLLKLVAMPDEPPREITPPRGYSVLIVPRSTPYDDESCYQLIAKETGNPPLDQHSDRCAVCSADGVVVEVQKRDPDIHSLQPGEASLVRHRAVEIGDVWDGAQMRRRHVRIVRTSRQVEAEVMVPVGDDGPQLPAVAAGRLLVSDPIDPRIGSARLKVGDRASADDLG